METSLLLLLVGFLVLVFLIFKFIKKAIFAVIALVALLVLIFGGTVGLVYLDMKSLAASEDYDIQLVLVDGENYMLGASMPVRDAEFDVDSVEGISRDVVDEISVEDITDEDNLFVVTIEKDFLETIMVEEYSFEGIELPEEMSDYDLTLSKEDILELIDEGSTSDEMVDILFEKNDVDALVAALGRPVLVSMIESYLIERDMSFRTAVFLVALTGSLESEANYLKLIDGFKEDGGIEVYPNRLTFTFVKMLPAGTIISFLGLDEE